MENRIPDEALADWVRDIVKPFSIRDLHSCAMRELDMRKMYYPGRVRSDRMKPLTATLEIQKQERICMLLVTLRDMAEAVANEEALKAAGFKGRKQ